ncbi:MAG: hypothetical protein ACRBB2_07520 [Nitrosopumilus sp.]
MEPDFSWMYLIFFLMIPLARIIPRVLSKFRKRDETFQTVQENQYQSGFEEQPRREYQKEEPKHRTKDMLVLGEINIGTKTFEGIQKKTQLGNEELDTILGDLERNGLLKVQQKQGLLGPKVELLPTDEGFRKYYK